MGRRKGKSQKEKKPATPAAECPVHKVHIPFTSDEMLEMYLPRTELSRIVKRCGSAKSDKTDVLKQFLEVRSNRILLLTDSFKI